MQTVLSFLGWCTVINWVFLMLWWLFFSFAHDWVYGVHSRWFTLSRERFDEIHYSGMAFFKLSIFLFNLTPYLALRLFV